MQLKRSLVLLAKRDDDGHLLLDIAKRLHVGNYSELTRVTHGAVGVDITLSEVQVAVDDDEM
jgi:hypothetical protein